MNNATVGKLTYRHVRETLATYQPIAYSAIADESIDEKLATAEKAYRIWMKEVAGLLAECKKLGHDLHSFHDQLSTFEAKIAG
ncbi:MAG: hypothetical protein BWK79_02100 [Beggiatoa sp. IS2]|nr:MAG: hypothetical protein BWK79_02100 [Beggiatoa sp. IS2]